MMHKKYLTVIFLLSLFGFLHAKCDYSKVSLTSVNTCNVYKFTVNGVTDTCNHLDIKIFKSGGTGTVGAFTSNVFYQTFTDTGSYYVRVSIKNKCCGSDTLFYNLVRVTCKPSTTTCNWKSRNMYFSVWDSCAGVKNKVSVNGYIGPFNGCYKYYWTVNGVAVSSARMMSYGITSNGTYNVCMKVVDTCNKCDTTFCSSRVITCASAGFVSEEFGAGIDIFPNPSEGQITIHCTSRGACFSLIDAKGSIVKSGNLTQETSNIDVSELPRGVYSISVVTANRRVTQIQVLH